MARGHAAKKRTPASSETRGKAEIVDFVDRLRDRIFEKAGSSGSVKAKLIEAIICAFYFVDALRPDADYYDVVKDVERKIDEIRVDLGIPDTRREAFTKLIGAFAKIEVFSLLHENANRNPELRPYYEYMKKWFDEIATASTFDFAEKRKAERETTARAAEPPRPDWIEAHKRGVTVPEFIGEAFAVELREGAMHKGLFSRYENLRRDFYSYKRSNELPDWLKAIPKKSQGNDRLVAEGKVTPAEAVRSGERDRKRIAAALRRGVVVAMS